MSEEVYLPEPASWMSPGVAGIGLASFFSDAGHEISTALLPDLLTVTLGAPASVLGLIEGISDGAAGAAKLAGGALADDPSRRRSIAIGGYSTTAVLVSVSAAATAAWQVGVLRAGAWAARGARGPARNAILADLVPPAAYGRAYGFERAMDNLGAIAGPLLAILLVGLVGVRNAIALSIIPGLLAAASIYYAVRRVPRASRGKREPIRLKIRPVLQGRLGRVMVGVTAFEFGNVAATLLILRATELLRPEHGRQAATQLAIGLYVAYNTAATLASVPAGRMSDARGTTRVLALGVALFALAYLGFAAGGPSVVALAPWFVAAGIGIGFVETSEHAAVAALAPEAIRSSAFGLLATIQSLGNFAASAIVGALWSAASPRVAFLYVCAFMLISLGAIFATRTTS
ncbi:MAG TPA: MFS transporter [Actinomycetota bacterium]|nr:MFS transporter [Actinomycetota bacterium]